MLEQVNKQPSGVAPIRTVIVTHAGSSPYLRICLRRAARAAGSGRVVLLGDGWNADYVNFKLANGEQARCEHHRIDDPSLQADLEEFRSIYQHISRLPFGAERFNTERWFLIRNFLRREGLDGCLAIDSDVLLFCDVAEESLRFSPYAMTLSRWDIPVRAVPHCNFIRGREGIEDFCQYVLDLYRNKERLDRLTALNHKKYNISWVGDMSLLAAWSASSRFPVGNLAATVADGVGYDSCMDDTKDFVSHGGLLGLLRPWKKLNFHEGIPYARLRGTGVVLPMKCVHYQGRMKLLMDRHDRGIEDDWSVTRTMLADKLARYPAKARLFYQSYLAPLFKTAAGETAASAAS